jgi:hypothetical protein
MMVHYLFSSTQVLFAAVLGAMTMAVAVAPLLKQPAARLSPMFKAADWEASFLFHDSSASPRAFCVPLHRQLLPCRLAGACMLCLGSIAHCSSQCTVNPHPGHVLLQGAAGWQTPWPASQRAPRARSACTARCWATVRAALRRRRPWWCTLECRPFRLPSFAPAGEVCLQG